MPSWQCSNFSQSNLLIYFYKIELFLIWTLKFIASFMTCICCLPAPFEGGLLHILSTLTILSRILLLSLQLVNKIIIYHTTQGMNLQKPFFIESGYSTFALQYCNTQQKVGILYIKCKCFMMYQINGVFSQ